VLLRTVLASLAEGDSIERLLRELPTLTEAHVRAAIAFAAASAVADMPAPAAPPAYCVDELCYCVDELCCAAASCLPYRCGPGGICLGTCSTTGDCAPGHVCAAVGRCLTPTAAAGADTTAGCACRMSSPGGTRPWSALGALLAALLFAGRRRSHPGPRVR
jgi:MYXO-CTERM domain-containing protein